MLTVQYPENRIRNLLDLRGIPLHGERVKDPTLLDAVTQGHADHVADRDRSLPDPAGHRHLREPGRRGSRRARERHPAACWHDARCRPASRWTCAAWCRACSASFTSFAPRPDPRARAAVPDSRRAVPIVPRSAPHPAGRADRPDRRAGRAVRHGHDAQRAVADGRADDGRHGRLQQHPDRRVHASAARTTACRCSTPSSTRAASGCGRF